MRGSLWLRSIARRSAAAAGLFVIVASATASAVAGPLLIRAAEQSGLRSELTRAAAGSYDIVVSAPTNEAGSDGALELLAAARAADPRLFLGPISAQQSSDQLRWVDASRHRSGKAVAMVLANGCGPLVLVSGTCPVRRGDILLPASATARPAALGQSLTFPGRTVIGVDFVVSGYYDAADPTTRALGDGQPLLFMTRPALGLLTRSTLLTARDLLRPDVLGLDELSAAKRSVDAVDQAALQQELTTRTDAKLPALADDVHAQERVANVLGLLIVVPVVLLSWYALVLIMQLIAVVRAPEWALGRLRGLPLWTWLRSLYAEPVALLAVGAVLGAGVGVAVAELTTRVSMADGTSLEPFRLPVLVALGGTVLGAAVGIAMATARGIRLPLATLLQESAEPTRISRTGAAAQVLLLAIAVLAVFQLRTQAQVSVGPANLGLLLPGLLAMLLTLVAIRIGTGVVRRRSGRPPRSVGSLVLGRRLARNPGMLWRHSVIAVATALAVFAVQLVVLMSRNVTLRAGNEVGAARVLHVRTVPLPVLTGAVRAADPAGRYAMATEELAGVFAGGTSRIVAVDAARLAAVSAWQPGWAGLDSAQVKNLLAPAHRAPVLLRGSAVHLTVADATLAASPYNIDPSVAAPFPTIVLVVERAGTWQDVPLGALTPRTHEFSAAIDCVGGCLLRQIQFRNGTDTMYSADFAITSLSTNEQPASRFAGRLSDPRNWQNSLALAEAGLPVSVRLGVTSGGLHVQLRDNTGHGTPAILPANGPSPVPALIANGTDATPLAGIPHAVNGTAFDGQSIPFRIVGRASALPRVVHDGVLVDLSAITRVSDPRVSNSIEEVWLAPGTPATVLRALHGHGLTVTSTERQSAVARVLGSASPVRAVRANATIVVLLALLAATALAAGLAIDAGRRRQYVRVLRDVGIDPRTICGLAMRELAVPATVAALIGTVAALGTMLLAGSRLPLFASSDGPPLATAPDWPSIALTLAVILVVTLVAAAGLAWSEQRAAALGGER